MEAELGGSSDFHYELFGAYIKQTTVDEENAITVTKLLDTAGISRTQFYLYYKNLEDFRHRFYYACFELAIEFLLHVCREDDLLSEEELSKIRDTIYAAYNQKAVRRLLSSGKLLEYGSYIVIHIYRRYLEQLERDYGPLDKTQKQTLVYYVGVLCTLTLWYYTHKIDYNEFCKNAADAKRIMRRALGIEP